jgi:hypothetical protein
LPVAFSANDGADYRSGVHNHRIRIPKGLFVNDGRNVRPVREAIDRRTEIDTRGLCDADIPLRALLAPQAV